MRTVNVVGYATAFSIVSLIAPVMAVSIGHCPPVKSPRISAPGIIVPQDTFSWNKRPPPCATVVVMTVCCAHVCAYFLTQQPRKTCKILFSTSSFIVLSMTGNLQKKLVSSCLGADIWGSTRTVRNTCSKVRFSGGI